MAGSVSRKPLHHWIANLACGDSIEKFKSSLDEDTAAKVDRAIRGCWVGTNKRTSSLGLYKPSTGEIELSSFLCDTAAPIQSKTLLHEIAHLLAHKIWNDRGHGTTWRWIAQSLGLSGERCADHHSTAAFRSAQPQKKLVGICTTCGKELRARRSLSADRKYTHVGCGGAVRRVKEL